MLDSLLIILGYGIIAVPTGIVSAELVRAGVVPHGSVGSAERTATTLMPGTASTAAHPSKTRPLRSPNDSLASAFLFRRSFPAGAHSAISSVHFLAFVFFLFSLFYFSVNGFSNFGELHVRFGFLF